MFSFPTGSSVDFTAVFVEEVKASITIVNHILQRSLTYDGGTSAFVAFAGSPATHLLDTSFQSCSGCVVNVLVI